MASKTRSEKETRARLGIGPYVLRSLLNDVPLSEDGARDDDIKINCVEYLDRNLYVGTSDSELLHFVQIPPGPTDTSGTPAFILASRLKPAFATPAASANSSRHGVQQILLLPAVNKACILCNSTVTFYSLPELSPSFGSRQVKNCNWIGGVDLNQSSAGEDAPGSDNVAILLSLNRKIQVVRIAEGALRVIANIEIPGTTFSLRRDTIACIADSRSYALVEVNQQLKIPLMSISSLDEAQPGNFVGQAQDVSGRLDDGLLRSNSTANPRTQLGAPDTSGAHRRGASLGNLISGMSRRQENQPTDGEDSESQQQPTLEQTAGSVPPEADAVTASSTAETRTKNAMPVLLKPHIASPTPEEFLLVTGTSLSDPGIGIFVNLDGDPTRPTIEFDQYPKEIAVDGGYSDLSSSRMSLGPEEEGWVLASMSREFADGIRYGLEIQRWDTGAAESGEPKHWLETPDNAPIKTDEPQYIGIRSLFGMDEIHFPEIADRICQRRFLPFSTDGLGASTMSLNSVDSRTASSLERMSKEKELFDRDNESQDEEPLPEGWQVTRNAEEEDFARRLAGGTARLAVWSGKNVWWAARNPLILQLEAQLEVISTPQDQTSLKRQDLFRILNSFRGRDAKSELEFLTFNYIRQRVGLLLLTSFLNSEINPFSEQEIRAMEEILVDSLLDPRVVLSLIPGVRDEVIETRRGIWIFGGVKKTAEEYISSSNFDKSKLAVNSLSQPLLHFLRRFLMTWRRKKGFGSVPDENEVFRTVDAALLAVLLELDQHSPPGLAKGRSIRAELYDLVDNGVDCFERAETLIDSYHRLFVLSRLYQSRKMASEVLATWKRIVEGERDDGQELQNGEQRVREYLANVNNQPLVQEYGIWLANRNPKLGVEVFAEDKGHVPRFEPTFAVDILKREAPTAVKYYLEHLVFGKGHTVYVNELITYYLDVVVDRLKSSPEAREVVMSTYVAYRALHPPKPTYRQFLTDNAPIDDEAWHSRLRLLQLFGGSYEFDVAAIRSRIASLSDTAEDLLVPETIILDGRERRHEDALRLLVHRLGDYDTAVAYCMRGGASIYSIYQATPSKTINEPLPPPSPEGLRGPKRRESMPPTENQQAQLFRALLGEFLDLEDVSDRVEQTSLLLEKFGSWFDVADVLSMIPDNWSVDLFGGFLVKALRRIVVEKNETAVARALSSAQNLKVQHDLIVKIEEKGPVVEMG